MRVSEAATTSDVLFIIPKSGDKSCDNKGLSLVSDSMRA